MTTITRRTLLCALPALPFLAHDLGRPRSLQVVISSNVLDSKAFVEQLIRDIREAADDRDAILIKSARPNQ